MKIIIILFVLVLSACAELRTDTEAQSLCQEDDSSCVPLAQSKQITRDYAQGTSSNYVDTDEVVCSTTSNGTHSGVNCGVSVLTDEGWKWASCTIYTDATISCAVS